MFITLIGKVSDVKPQPEKAQEPMLATLLPILTDVKYLHCQYLQPVITQYFVSNKLEIWS